MGVDYINCDECGEVFNDCSPYSYCIGCGRSYCKYCENSVNLITDENGETISCKYCKLQKEFEDIIKKYPEITLDELGFVIFNSDNFKIKFNLGELESYTISFSMFDDKYYLFKFNLINNTEGTIKLTKKIEVEK